MLSKPCRLPAALGVLEAFGVAFAVFGSDGLASYVSREAEQLGDSALQASIWTQARLLANAALDEAGFPDKVDYPTARGYGLAVHRLPPGDPDASLVIIIKPVTYRRAAAERERPSGLTDRETEVARLIAIGQSNKQIAARLGVSNHTARHHTEKIFRKLGVTSRSQLAALVTTTLPLDRSA